MKRENAIHELAQGICVGGLVEFRSSRIETPTLRDKTTGKSGERLIRVDTVEGAHQTYTITTWFPDGTPSASVHPLTLKKGSMCLMRVEKMEREGGIFSIGGKLEPIAD